MNTIVITLGIIAIVIAVGLALYAIVDVLRRKKADRG